MEYFKIPREKTWKYPPAPKNPSEDEYSLRFTRMKFPIAVPITVAFQVSMKIAPALYTKAKSTENSKTLELFRKIFPKCERLLTAFHEKFLLMDCIVAVCLSKSMPA